ncbi:MAG TPA: HAD-IIIC family phosphatase [Pyrinomonadaceae bacterium]|jgi:FkbH-like protein
MKLSEALKIVQIAPASTAEKLTVFLACGFTPLHLTTFLTAHLRRRLPNRVVEIQTGLYGDLPGNITRLRKSKSDVGVIMLEWSDFDPRLGLRSLGGWGPKAISDIQENVVSSANRFYKLLEDAGSTSSVVVSLPTLPLPPISHLPEAQIGGGELSIRKTVQDFAFRIAEIPDLKILNQQQLDETVPLSERLDVKAELAAGFPYQIAYASVFSDFLAGLIHPSPPKKGLITDLDDTLWKGILGEIGIAKVSWDLDKNSHIHGLYQQTLAALAESGVLIGVASKNDHDLVTKALQRKDLIFSDKHLFPLEINWQQKSRSVGKILRAWNIDADAVVFVDDSPIELAEVNAVYPEMECLLFPKNDYQAAYRFMRKLRGMFGKQSILEEDAIRVESLRRAREFQNETIGRSSQSLEDFLENVGAELTFGEIEPDDSRAFELINKTNQFNLNGRRLSSAEFRAVLRRPGAVSFSITYKDKFGPLGKIAVLLGAFENSVLTIGTWVMSCRAFSRHIEHRCLQYLFENYDVSEIELTYQATERNEPVRQFLLHFSDEKELTYPYKIEREVFMNKKPALLHDVVEVNNV